MIKSKYLDLIANQSRRIHKPTLVYVGIGCVARCMFSDSENKTLSDSDNQEYPIFLQSIKNQIPNSELHIFMIDPLIEDVPFVISNNDGKTVKQNWNQLNNEVFFNDHENTTIYKIKDEVSLPYYQTNGVDYSIFFDKLNKYGIEEHWTVIVCQYTGIRLNVPYDYYENQLVSHLDHIIYRLFTDDENQSSCMLDMNHTECQYSFECIDNQIKIFNPFMYKKNYQTEFPEIILSLTDQNQKNIVITQMLVFLNIQKTKIKQLMYDIQSISRCIKLKTALSKYAIDRITNEYQCNQDCIEEFNDMAYSNLFKILIEVFSHILIQYIFMIHHGSSSDIVFNRINQIINENNYNIYNNYVSDLYIDYSQIF